MIFGNGGSGAGGGAGGGGGSGGVSVKTLRVLLEQLEAAKAQIIKQRCVEGVRFKVVSVGVL